MMTTQRAITAPAAAATPRTRWSALAKLRVRHFELPLLAVSGVLLIASILLPYWNIVLYAPQYPKGLSIDVFVYKMTPAKNVFEVDTLNHYIGMIALTDAATVEQGISRFGIPLIALLMIASFWLRGAWRWIARLPVMLYPVIFVADLFGWLYYAGHSLDKHAPLSSSIKEFTPRLFGHGTIGQFKTEAEFQIGFFLAVAAAVIVLVVTLLNRGWDDARA